MNCCFCIFLYFSLCFCFLLCFCMFLYVSVCFCMFLCISLCIFMYIYVSLCFLMFLYIYLSLLSWGPSPLIVRGGTTDSVAEKNRTFSYDLLPVSQVSVPNLYTQTVVKVKVTLLTIATQLRLDHKSSEMASSDRTVAQSTQTYAMKTMESASNSNSMIKIPQFPVSMKRGLSSMQNTEFQNQHQLKGE